jgi:hypothetical protein
MDEPLPFLERSTPRRVLDGCSMTVCSIPAPSLASADGKVLRGRALALGATDRVVLVLGIAFGSLDRSWTMKRERDGMR